MTELVLTVPRPERHPRFWPTGNEWVSLPTLDPATAGLHSVGAISMQRRALVELVGEDRRPGARPLLRPRIALDGQDLALTGAGLTAERLDEWIPRFTVEAPGARAEITFFAPPGERGFVVLFELSARPGRAALRAELGLEGCLGGCELAAFRPRRPPCERLLFVDPWTGALVLEGNLDAGLLALGLGCEGGTLRVRAGTSGTLAPLAPGRELVEPNRGGELLAFVADTTLALAPGETARVAFHVAVAPERDGARTGQVHLRRHGATALLARTRAHLAARRLRSGRPDLDAFLNRNALFNLYYAAGRALDTEEWVALTSRSPAYYVSGATWERDALLWSFPALLLSDRDVAREVLASLFRRHARNAGEHAHYIDGSVLYPGFELDELCAYLLALDRYLAATGDRAFLERPEVRGALPRLEAALLARRHPDPAIALYSTFLLSSDDPTPHPWVTYDNVVAWRALRILGALARGRGDSRGARRHEEAAARTRDAIGRHLVHPARGVFSWSSDLAGEHRIYDEPSGSLLLLPHLGFCAPDDPTWRRTIDLLYGADDPYTVRGVPFPGRGCAHYADPGTLGLAAELLAGRHDEAARVLRDAPLDAGLACESYDPQTGEARTGAAFATCAGYLAWAIVEAFGHAEGPARPVRPARTPRRASRSRAPTGRAAGQSRRQRPFEKR